MGEKVKRKFSAGGVVFRNEPEGTLWLLIRQKGDQRWRLPKGWIEPGENSREAAQREVKEEGGIETEVLGKIGQEKYFFVQDRQKIFKTVSFYLMKYLNEAQGELSCEIEEIAWLPFEEARQKLAFENERELLEKAKKILGKLEEYPSGLRGTPGKRVSP